MSVLLPAAREIYDRIKAQRFALYVFFVCLVVYTPTLDIMLSTPPLHGEYLAFVTNQVFYPKT